MSARTTAATVLTMIVGSAVRLVAQAQPDVSTDLYYLSLDACLHARADDHKNSEMSPSGAIVLADTRITGGFPASVGPFRVEYLESAALKRRYAQSKTEFAIVGMTPMRNLKNLLIVRCWNYSVRVRSRKLILGVMGGWDVEWLYDCGSGNYAIVNVKKWWPQM